MQTKNTLRILKIACTICFIVLMALRVYVDISRHHSFRISNILLLSTFIATFYYKTKTSWLVAVGLCIWGIYYYLVKAVKVAEPGVCEFTRPLMELLFKDTTRLINKPFYHFIDLFPFLFYIITIIIFMTNRVRRQYWQKAPPRSIVGKAD